MYGYPIDEAARIAVATVADFLAGDEQLTEVILAAFGAAIENALTTALAEAGG